jgi:O-antigen ligase
MSVAITLVTCCICIVLSGRRGLIGFSMLAASIIGLAFLLTDPGFSSVDDAVGFLKQDQSNAELGSLSGREEMWTAMWKSYQESKWIGHGYFVSSSRGSIEVWYKEGNWTAHNVVLQTLVSTGLIGAFLLTAGLVWPLMRLVFRKSLDRDMEQFKKFIAIMFLRYACWGMLNESFVGPLQLESVVFFILIGLVASYATANFDHHVNQKVNLSPRLGRRMELNAT